MLFIPFIQLCGIYLFSTGFLLSRQSLQNISTAQSLIPTHSKVVLIILDALRYDFLTDEGDNQYYHRVLTLPNEMSKKYPTNSWIFNSYADPPTSTMQRIKALVTGSLPTFVDITAQFGLGGVGAEEDNWLIQARRANKTTGFVGDDTWTTLYPHSFDTAYPFDSFNVEDLDGVDDGVEKHLFGLIEGHDVVVAHMLGLDHVGHRLSPEHPHATRKLRQYNDLLTRIVEAISNDTLLIVMGDHGMDPSGDHGGDGVFETSAGMWVYSPGAPFSPLDASREHTTFPGHTSPSRLIQQIDIVPSLSLLLGLPIPFGNLGSLIPELFTPETYKAGLELVVQQMRTYTKELQLEVGGDDADPYSYTRHTLSHTRSIWAQFSIIKICMGLLLLFVSVVSQPFPNKENDLHKLTRSAAIGSISGVLVSLLQGEGGAVDALDMVIFLGALLPALSSLPATNVTSVFPLLLPTLHFLSHFSNSFILWEHRLLLWLLGASTIPLWRLALALVSSKRNILTHLSIFLFLSRIVSMSEVCREELMQVRSSFF